MNSPLHRRSFAVLLLALGMVLLPNTNPPVDAQQATTTTLRIGTVAPNGSPWHRVFSAWSNSLREATHGRVALQVVTQPTERAMIADVRSGTLQGAVVSSIGLGQINHSLLVLQAPGAFADNAALDRARTAMDTDLRAMFTSEHMELVGWGDLGRGRIFSAAPIRQPSDLHGLTVWQPADELVSSQFLSVVGATPVTLPMAQVRPGLGSRVQVVMASAMAVGAMNWNSALTNVTVQSPGALVGATVLSQASVSALSAEDQAALRSTGTRAHTALQRQLRQDDERYYTTLTSRGMTANDNSANAAAWATAEASVRTRITTGSNALFPAALLTPCDDCRPRPVMQGRVIFVDIDDTMVRSVGNKRIPMPGVIAEVKRLKAEGATLYLWSSGGAEYCKRTAEELGITACFEAFLPKPHVYIDDQPVHEWRFCKHLYPSQAEHA